MRLIDADALMKELEPNNTILESHLVYKMAVKHAMSKVKDAPTIDAVSVVRCGECKHRNKHFSCSGRRDDWFCPNGERRSENE